jgi:hypothetical protein
VLFLLGLLSDVPHWGQYDADDASGALQRGQVSPPAGCVAGAAGSIDEVEEESAVLAVLFSLAACNAS